MTKPTNPSKTAAGQAAAPGPRRGLILGGGGSKGSYTAGVWRALREAGQHFDIVAGTSIGALIGAMVTADDFEGCMNLLSGMGSDSVTTHPFLFPSQYLNQSMKQDQVNTFLQDYSAGGPSFRPLQQAYLKYFNFEKFESSPIDFACVTYNLSQARPQVFYKAQMTEENFMDQLLASASYFPSYNFCRMGDDYYIDGSFAEIVPWKTGLQMGAQELTVISLAEPGEKDDVPSDAGFTVIRPILKLAYAVDFESSTLMRQAEIGYLEGLKYLGKAPGYLYTFRPEDSLPIDAINKMGSDLLRRKKVDLSQSLLNEIWNGLLGYIPTPLHTKSMENYSIMYIIEALGICASMPFDRQYSLKEFFNGILDSLGSLSTTVLEKGQNQCNMYEDMQHRGIQDVIVFFHTAMNCFGTDLPPQLDVLKTTWILPYYLALAWRIIEKSRWIWNLI